MLYSYNSNSIYTLIDKFAKIWQQKRLYHPLETSLLCVQNAKQAKFIRHLIAKQTGICANMDSILPVSLLWFLYKSTIDNVPANNQYAGKSLSWHIFNNIEKFTHLPSFLQENIKKDHSAKWLLCNKISDILDKAQYYRTTELLNSKNKWSALLWQKITFDDKNNVPELVYQFLNTPYNKLNTKNIPKPLFLFLPISTPPIVYEVIKKISRIIDIYSFYQTPSPKYWPDLVSFKEKLGRQKNHKQELYYESENELIGSWARSSADFFTMVQNDFTQELHNVPTNTNILSNIHYNIYNLKNKITPIKQNDKSIQVHLCYNKIRECQVILDVIYDLFASDNKLQKEDICITAPNINEYADVFYAVFAGTSFGFDFYQTQDDDIIFKILDFCQGRWTFSDFMELLSDEQICKKYNFTTQNIIAIKKILNDANLRWGIDSEHKKSLGFLGNDSNTWDFVFKRLFASFAVGGYVDMYQNIALMKDLGQDNFYLLANVYDIFKTIHRFYLAVKKPKTLQSWAQQLDDISYKIVIYQNKNWHKFIKDLQKNRDENVYDLSFIKDVYVTYLTEKYSLPFLQGGISFANLHDCAWIPFKIRIIVGMQRGTYPKYEKTNSFDEFFNEHKPGDINRTNEDRAVFLSTILNTSNNLVISYIGLDEKNNTTLPANFILEKLISYIGVDNIKIIQKKHPLHPFDISYFNKETSLVGYQQKWYKVANTKKATPLGKTNFLLSKKQKTKWNIQELCDFYKNSSYQFLQRHFNIRFDDDFFVINDDEPMVIDNLNKWILKNETIKDKNKFSKFAAEGLLPQGAIRESLKINNQNFIKMIPDYLLDIINLKTQKINSKVQIPSGFSLHIKIENYYPQKGVIFYKASSINGFDIMKLWIYFLSLQCVENVTKKAVFSYFEDGRFQKISFENKLTKQDVIKYLQDLTELASKGLSTPLPIFTNCAYELVKSNKIKDWLSPYSKDNTKYSQLLFDESVLKSKQFKKISHVMFDNIIELL
jgi:exodeoxyribonuclease V gamma subunit